MFNSNLEVFSFKVEFINSLVGEDMASGSDHCDVGRVVEGLNRNSEIFKTSSNVITLNMTGQ